MLSTALSTLVATVARKRFPGILADHRALLGPGQIDHEAAWREAVETAGLKFGLRDSDLEVVWVGLAEAPTPPNAHRGQ